MLPPKKFALASTDFRSCSSCCCVLLAMNIEILPSEIAGDMPGVSKLPGYIQLEYCGILLVISGCANRIIKMFNPGSKLMHYFLMVKACSFLIDREGCDKLCKEKEEYESKLKSRHLLLCTALPQALLGDIQNDTLLLRTFDCMPRNSGEDYQVFTS